jgi:RNA polymerase sigma-70 factor (ECF subfamily)
MDGPDVALTLVEELEGDPRLVDYHYLPAIKADLLRRLGREDEALTESQRALGLVRNDAERAFLDAQLRGRGSQET